MKSVKMSLSKIALCFLRKAMNAEIKSTVFLLLSNNCPLFKLEKMKFWNYSDKYLIQGDNNYCNNLYFTLLFYFQSINIIICLSLL